MVLVSLLTSSFSLTVVRIHTSNPVQPIPWQLQTLFFVESLTLKVANQRRTSSNKFQGIFCVAFMAATCSVGIVLIFKLHTMDFRVVSSRFFTTCMVCVVNPYLHHQRINVYNPLFFWTGHISSFWTHNPILFLAP